MDNQATGNMVSEEEKRKFEENYLFVISAAENGDEEQRKFLNEKSFEELAIAYNLCRPEVILRLGEYYCCSSETLDKGSAIYHQIDADLDQIVSSCSESTAVELRRFCIFAMLLKNVITNLADCDTTEKLMFVQQNIESMCVLAENYTLAQYWMGQFAELDIDYGNPDKSTVDRWTRATKYYRRASAQGCFSARNALKELPAKREKKMLEERKERRLAGKCQHCGGSFKGLFKKVCSSCGKPKDY